MLIICYFIVFFFFQAEDGIRDGHVTGVQTCALPIPAGAGASATIPWPGRRRESLLWRSPRVANTDWQQPPARLRPRRSKSFPSWGVLLCGQRMIKGLLYQWLGHRINA